MDQTKQLQIVPYCIYHYLDPVLNTFYGYIGNPSTIKKSSGNIELNCRPLPNWKLYNSFYAFSPMIRPIPNGLKLMNAIKIEQHPFYTKTIETVYDPFDINKKSVSFLTWNQPVTNTIPLYIHITPYGNSFPSFDKNPPINEKGWTQSKMSPVFVLVDPIISNINKGLNGYPIASFPKDENGIPIFTFSIKDNKCHPEPNGISLEKCFLTTDKDLLRTGNYNARTLLQQIKKLDDEKLVNKKHIKKFFSRLSDNLIIIITVIFLISLVSCIILLNVNKTILE